MTTRRNNGGLIYAHAINLWHVMRQVFVEKRVRWQGDGCVDDTLADEPGDGGK